LGESALTDHIRCWLHLVSATSFDPAAKIARPARRDEHCQPNVEEPRWFRIGQFRLRSHAALALVQRSVSINSFAFTLLIAPVESEWPCQEFTQWIDVFTTAYPEAMPVLPTIGSSAA